MQQPEEGEREEDVALTFLQVEKQEDQYTLQVTNDAFLDDWYHRGSVLGWMSAYVYAMYVKVVPRAEGEGHNRMFPFESHYKKFAQYVQILEVSPRVPYMVGFTMPSRASDAATNALFHLSLLKPSRRCRGDCNDVAHLSGHVLSHRCSETWNGLFGYTEPNRKAKPRQGESRFVEAWKAWEALQLTRAEAAWRKLKLERRVAVLDDVVGFRTWYLPNVQRETVVQSWLLPWLLGEFRHVYKGPWKEKRSKTMVNPRYTKAQFMARHPSGAACLPPLPHAVAIHVLRLTGHVRADDNTLVVIADDEIVQQKLVRMFRGKDITLTGTGAHLQQLFPEEFAATIAAEVACNMDLLAEARKRPRPNANLVVDDVEDDALGGNCPGRMHAEEHQDSDGQSEYDAIMEQPYSEERGLQYRPHIEVQECDVLEIAHRLKGQTNGRGLCHYV